MARSKQQGPKVVTLDIETAPLESYHWGLWDQNIGLEMIKEDWSILSFSAKWLGSDEVIFKHTGGRGPNKVRDDSVLLQALWDILDEAEWVVAQNGKEFDLKKINARLIQSGFAPYSPVRVVDTMLAAKKTFGFTSNKLAWLTKNLTKAKKSEHKRYPGFALWAGCLRDEKAAWKEMQHYNGLDVISTEELFLKLRPWIDGLNAGIYFAGDELRCPKCGSTELTKWGMRFTATGQFQSYKCKSCGGRCHEKSSLTSKSKRKSLLGG